MFRLTSARRAENDQVSSGPDIRWNRDTDCRVFVEIEEMNTDYGPFGYYCPGCQRKVENLLDLIFEVKGYEVSLKRCQDCVRIANEHIPHN